MFIQGSSQGTMAVITPKPQDARPNMCCVTAAFNIIVLT